MRASAPRSLVARIIARALPALALAAVVTGAVGCLTADGTLEADGSATLSLSYGVPPGTTDASQRSALQAPGVTIESLSVSPDHAVSARLRLADPSALAKTAFFKDVKVSRRTEDKVGVLSIEITAPDRKVDDKKLHGPKIGITLPGKVLEANEHAVVDGAHVQWNFQLADFLARKTWNLMARYEAPLAPAGTATTSTTVPKGD
jgi:hypothetical protein